MVEFLSKALDLLKASGWQTACLAIACALFLFLSARGFLPPLSPTFELTVWAALFVSAALSVASIGPAIERGLKSSLVRRSAKRHLREVEDGFREYVPFLSERERQIFGYLLHYRIKTFTADHDGGYAATLLARGYIRFAGVRGQRFDLDKCPMLVPEYVWKVLEEDTTKFPYIPDMESGHEAQPWRIHWMVR
ncbi:hypothetical protein [Rhizobium ruizarguesonis]|uniref:hypothetical protein n=1 Tax=Rhizobium ruizarguesonis TaxID=2081791 RepID=UPI00103043BA|nr:hypothetical protein [Rhizobium ruizarguesonis]NEH81850.1 hypothetical protein [Rhizobium ruizarguesonis]NEI79466.1 hypothetical protein [Rhizobium ruizarguesonis]TBA20218.1 hypothetical protein ELH66_03935 [Rhizobium ruizarguesonis]TBD62653.1 hypothetical protein ELH22_04530 [Rhizobium ruizarguesonis]